MKRPLVFIVDDDDAIREAFTEVLSDHGFDVHAYRNGREAVDALDRAERPSLILLDWMMPVMNGSEFVRQSQVGEIPVVVISAVAENIPELPRVRERVGKPLGLTELVRTVERHCEHVLEEEPRAAVP
jgi:CheY-like chemotaxis protein